MKFIDNDFPPTEASIVGHSDKNLIDDTVNHWRRPGGEKGFFGGKPYQLIHRINCHHLLQGKLCDYSFYSVVVCLALGNESLI